MFRTALFVAGQLLIGAQAALVTYNFNVTRGVVTGDGQNKTAWLINGQSPGPTITATKGDKLQITVRNNGNEEITIHWHGLEQINTPYSDGVPGLTQYPIAVGSNFVYKYDVTQSGAFWYHSHSHHQLADGLVGAMVLKPDANTTSSITAISGLPYQNKALAAEKNARPVVIADNTHLAASYMVSEWNRTHIEQLCLDNILINGKGQVVCPNLATLQPKVPPILGTMTARGCTPPSNGIVDPYGNNASAVDPAIWSVCTPTNSPLEVFQVNATNDRYVVFNVVNAGTLWDLKFSIDSHSFYVFAADGNLVIPQLANVINVGVGERYQLLVPLTQTPDDYTIRVSTNILLQYINSFAVLSYRRTPAPTLPFTAPPSPKNPYIDADSFLTSAAVMFEHHDLHPFPTTVKPPQGPADYTLRLKLTRTSSQAWALNGQNLVAPPASFTPLLFNPAGVSMFSTSSYTFVPMGSIVDVIIEVEVQPTGGGHPSHPMHKHNVHAFYLGSGVGEFPGTDVWTAWQANSTASGLNLNDPALRDTFATISTPTGKSWVAFRWESINPMPTLLHCHLEPHMSTGMQFVIMEAMESMGAIPAAYRPPGMCS